MFGKSFRKSLETFLRRLNYSLYTTAQPIANTEVQCVISPEIKKEAINLDEIFIF